MQYSSTAARTLRMVVLTVAVWGPAVLAIAQPAPGAAPPAGAGPAGVALVGYELQAFETARQRLGVRIDPVPEGKVLGRIHVLNLPVFSPQDGFLQFFNLFHRTTRDRAIRREVLLEPGQLWNQELVDETKRRLRDQIFTTVVVVVPVVAARAGEVDLLVITRDVWSLRFNSRFEVQESALTQLSLSLSENNLMGWRKQVAFVFDMDQGAYSLGPYYLDKNLFGSKLQLLASASAIFHRQTSAAEGSQSKFTLTYPLWSLERAWGAGITGSHFDGVVRQFLGNDLRLFDPADPGNPAPTTGLPRAYGLRLFDLRSEVVRSFGRRFKHRVLWGHQFRLQRPRVLDDFAGSAEERAIFVDNVLPFSERISAPFIGYQVFTPRFTVYRDIDTYDVSEDAKLGPELQVELAWASKAFGSEGDFLFGTASASWGVDLGGDGFFASQLTGNSRLADTELINNQVTSAVAVVTPRLGNVARVVTRASLGLFHNEQQNRSFVLGGDSSLRGYPVNAFRGDARFVANLEVRTMSWPVWFARLGGLVFWDVGHAAPALDELRPVHDVGVGLRVLLPQLGTLVQRLDWAIPLVSAGGQRSGLPGRITAGVGQVF